MTRNSSICIGNVIGVEYLVRMADGLSRNKVYSTMIIVSVILAVFICGSMLMMFFGQYLEPIAIRNSIYGRTLQVVDKYLPGYTPLIRLSESTLNLPKTALELDALKDEYYRTFSDVYFNSLSGAMSIVVLAISSLLLMVLGSILSIGSKITEGHFHVSLYNVLGVGSQVVFREITTWLLKIYLGAFAISMFAVPFLFPLVHELESCLYCC